MGGVEEGDVELCGMCRRRGMKKREGNENGDGEVVGGDYIWRPVHDSAARVAELVDALDLKSNSQ